MKHIMILFSFVLFTSSALASQSYELLNLESIAANQQEALDESAESTKERLRNGEVEGVLRQGLEIIVRAATHVLENEGHEDFAQVKLNEWEASFSLHTVPVGLLDLGEHSPLSQWLDDFYKGLEARLSSKVIRFFNLDDIRTFNYGIPVSVHPWSNPWEGGEWGSDEYADHFVPTSAAATYWISQQVCSLGIPLPYSLACGLAARIPRFAMKHFVGPKISDLVYEAAN